jgi:hypothetical protein
VLKQHLFLSQTVFIFNPLFIGSFGRGVALVAVLRAAGSGTRSSYAVLALVDLTLGLDDRLEVGFWLVLAPFSGLL